MWPIASCQRVQAAFNVPAGVSFQTLTAAQQVGRAVSCSKGVYCPTRRFDEFFILQTEINSIKATIMAGNNDGTGFNPNDDKLPTCVKGSKEENLDHMQAQMVNAALAFQYLNRPEAHATFVKVNERIQDIM